MQRTIYPGRDLPQRAGKVRRHRRRDRAAQPLRPQSSSKTATIIAGNVRSEDDRCDRRCSCREIEADRDRFRASKIKDIQPPRPAGARRHRLDRKERAALQPARTSAASSTRCSTPSITSARPRSSPRPAARAPSPSPRTWPAAVPTSSSAAIAETMAWALLQDKYATRLDVPQDEWHQARHRDRAAREA